MNFANARTRWTLGVALAAACTAVIGTAAAVAAQQAAAPAPVAAPVVEDIPFASPDAGAVTVPSAPDAWGGPRTGNEPTLSDRVVAYRIQATLDPTSTPSRQAATDLAQPQRSPGAAVYLHLYLNAFEGPGSTFYTEQRNNHFGFRSGVSVKEGGWGYTRLQRVAQGGSKVAWRYVQPDGGPATDRTVVRLDLPEAVAPGGSTTLDIDFFNQLPRVSARTGYYGTFHLVGQWFPKIGVLELPGERGRHRPTLERPRVPPAQRVLRRLRRIRRLAHRAQGLDGRRDRRGTGQARRTRRHHHPSLRAGRRARLRLDRRQALRQAARRRVPRRQRPGESARALPPGIHAQRQARARRDHRLAHLLLEDARRLPVPHGHRRHPAVQRRRRPAAWSTRRSSPRRATPTSTRARCRATRSTS
jgi:hypothetical protein